MHLLLFFLLGDTGHFARLPFYLELLAACTGPGALVAGAVASQHENELARFGG